MIHSSKKGWNDATCQPYPWSSYRRDSARWDARCGLTIIVRQSGRGSCCKRRLTHAPPSTTRFVTHHVLRIVHQLCFQFHVPKLSVMPTFGEMQGFSRISGKTLIRCWTDISGQKCVHRLTSPNSRHDIWFAIFVLRFEFVQFESIESLRNNLIG